MRCALALALLLIPSMPEVTAQATGVLQIKVVLLDAERTPTPVARHGLLVSDYPASAAPRMIVTGLDGTATVKLRPGTYTVESDGPVSFHGKGYQWRETVQVAAGRESVLELTAANAEVVSAPSAAASAGASPESDPSMLLARWRDSVVGIWTSTTYASGFVADARGLVATSQRAIGGATSGEVQLAPAVKVPARVLASDPARNVAILWVDPKAIASARPVPLPCTQPPTPIAGGQEIFAFAVSLFQQKRMASATVSRVDGQSADADVDLGRGGAGGPVFAADGSLVGLTSLEASTERTRGNVAIVPAAAACEVLAAAEKQMKDAAPPGGSPLPVEPERPFPVDALREAAKRAVSVSPYRIAASSFDVTFITPVLMYGVQFQSQQGRGRTTSKDTRKPDADLTPAPDRALTEFGNWSAYAAAFPPVLMIRVTPKLQEGFWTMVGRNAARTQGVDIPPIKRLTSGFVRLRAYCGDAEATPVHPFVVEQRLSEKDVIREGLYVFDPQALGPACGSVKIVLYSEKEPEKGDTRTVDPAIVQRIWDDFAPYRSQTDDGRIR